MAKSVVYYGSPRQARLVDKETLPAKLELIIDQLHLRDRVKGELVLLKMHTGNNMGYSTIHPVFVRRVVKAIKDGGGIPFIADVTWDVEGAETRGYTQEVLGCPIYPAGGLKDEYYYSYERPYKNIQTWKLAGMVKDATFLVDFAHAKGHPSCSYGNAFKNLALGCMVGETRSAMHDACHYDQYWFRDLCPDEKVRKAIVACCPQFAIVEDRHDSRELHLHVEQCNQCGRCLEIAPEGSLKIDPVNFVTFQEACAISTSIALSTFDPGKSVFFSLATQMTPVCDCFGFTSMPILPDAGVFGSDDIVALDKAVLDSTAHMSIIEENLPTTMEITHRTGHPFSWMHGKYKDPYKVVEFGEQMGLGSQDYELVDVFPVENIVRAPIGHISAR
jgi:uncharacterized protein